MATAANQNGGGGAPQMQTPVFQAPGQNTEQTQTQQTPQANPNPLAGFAPANIQQFGPTPTVSPTYANAAYINPANAQWYTQSYLQALNQAMSPEFAQQQAQLEEQNRARGIQDSGSASYLMGNLEGQQAGAYAQAAEPIIGQGFGYAQQDVTGNAQNQQQVNLLNANSANNATAENAAAYNQDRYANYGTFNNYLDQLMQGGMNYWDALQQAQLGTYSPNPSMGALYGGAVSGYNNTYENVFNNAQNEQNQALNNIFYAAAGGGGG